MVSDVIELDQKRSILIWVNICQVLLYYCPTKVSILVKQCGDGTNEFPRHCKYDMQKRWTLNLICIKCMAKKIKSDMGF